jgi:DNA-binding transcriptional LysR family regulator
VLALVAAGQGVAIVPLLAVDEPPAGVCLARPAGRRLARRVLAAARAGRGGHPAVMALLNALREGGRHTVGAHA